MKMSEEKSRKLELPVGTRRFLLAAILLIGVLIMLIKGMEIPRWLISLVGIIIAFFFVSGHLEMKK